MLSNYIEPPKSNDAPAKALWIRLVVSFILGSGLSLAAYAIMFEVRPYAALPPAIHFPIYWLWATPPLILGAKNDLAILISGIAWGSIFAAARAWFALEEGRSLFRLFGMYWTWWDLLLLCVIIGGLVGLIFDRP